MSKPLKIFIGILVLVVVIFLIQKSRNNQTQNSQAIKIGAVYDLSGVFADGGKAFMEGNEIAKEIINSEGGINGRLLELLYEDDPNQEAKAAINAANKLIHQDKVETIITTTFSGLAGMQTLAETSKTPIVNIIDGSDKISPLGEWLFGVGIYDEGQGYEVGTFARETLKLTKAAVIAGKDEYLLTVADAFESKFKELGGTITGREEFIVGETDFRTKLAKLINSGAEAIFFSHLGEGGPGIKQANELGFKGVFLGTDTMSVADVPKVAGAYLDNRTYFALWRNFDALTDGQKEFAEKYKTKYGKEPGDYLFYNVLGYDGLMVLAEAIKNSDGTGAGIKDALYKIQNFDGLSGPISIDETGINRDPKSAMVMYKNGKIVRYKK